MILPPGLRVAVRRVGIGPVPPLRIMLREVGRELTRAPVVLPAAWVKFVRSPGFTRSDAWVRLRYEFMRDHGGRCRCCGRGAADTLKVNVDHILPRKTHPEFALAYSNLQVLCSTCNRGKGNRDQTDWRFKARAGKGDAPAPACEACKVPMVLRTGPRGDFRGCSRFPECRSTRPRSIRRMPRRRGRRR